MINELLLTELKKELERRYIPDFGNDFIVLHLDGERFVFTHKNSGITLKINYLRQDKARVAFSASREILNSFNKKSIEHENKFIEIHEDCGFVLKRNCYAEFLLTYDSLFYEHPDYYDNFDIGECEVEISEPSSLYKLLFNSFGNDKSFISWNTLKTMKITNFPLDKLENYLQQVLFIVSKYDTPEFERIGDYPSIIPYQYHGEGMMWNDPGEREDFDGIFTKPLKYLEPIAFFNRARKVNDPMYYYRAIEFFFIINKKSNIKQSVEAYNESQDMDKLIKELTNLYSTKEVELLKNLLINLNGVEKVIQYAKNNGLIDNTDIFAFSTSLYIFRNSIVHGKGDTKFTLNIPTIEVLHPKAKDLYWTEVLKSLADLVIKQFCFE
ncbi:hypothetical protein GC101_15930 [Paenibacillus sp. LMG 31459]|uniref:Apea-like HEPN domain-containing protein n=1 Tax=Paenibacillus phytohabitans TaxID=2654978 RepID=A0ABX1YKP6_9BACL|nr:hypothetical protein [Paenibacillus phytohabitans]NOU80360.1 hypothetical protein [Paenibacillus phytohabitans]